MNQISNPDAERRLADHRARLQAAGSVPMTAEEILSGQTQAGVPPPSSFVRDDTCEKSVEFVGTGKVAGHE